MIQQKQNDVLGVYEGVRGKVVLFWDNFKMASILELLGNGKL